MKVRRAINKDIGRIGELLVQVNNVHAAGRPDLFVMDCRKYTDDELKEIIADDNRPIYVCVNDEDVVLGYGFCVIEDIAATNNMPARKNMYIDDICVDEACRKQHVGSNVYEYITNEAKNMGCTSITLNVWELNPVARKFYENMGLSPLKTMMEKVL